MFLPCMSIEELVLGESSLEDRRPGKLRYHYGTSISLGSWPWWIELEKLQPPENAYNALHIQCLLRIIEWGYYKVTKFHGWLMRHAYLLATPGGSEHSAATEPVPNTWPLGQSSVPRTLQSWLLYILSLASLVRFSSLSIIDSYSLFI